MRRFIMLALVILLMITAGCQPAPESSAVASKNDGTFEAALENTADNEEDTADGEEKTEASETYTDAFTSSDGSISYTVDIEIPDASMALPVLQVTPHVITVEDAKQAAEAIFGTSELYEYSLEMTKSEIEEEILTRQAFISDWDALIDYYDGDEELANQVLNEYQARITSLEAQYETAPEVSERQLFNWEFQPGADSEADEAYKTNGMRALVVVDGIPWNFSVTSRDESDYRIENIYAYINDSSLEQSDIYSDKEPTQEDIEDTTDKAETLLSEIGFGDWAISSYNIMSRKDGDSDKTLYYITFYATGVYNGIQVTYQPPLATLKSDDAYASNYNYEEIELIYSGGQLISLILKSPLDVVSEVNANVSALSFDEVYDSFKTQMRLKDASYYLGGVSAETTVTHVTLWLSLIRIKDNSTDFYLVPSYTFYGTTTYHGEDEYDWIGPDEVILDEEIHEDLLLIVNAVDGSVINTSLGF